MSDRPSRRQPAAARRHRPATGLLITAITALPYAAIAADTSPPASGHPAGATTQPAADVVGDRVAFLVARLAGVEESLKAVEAELKAAGYKAAASADQAKQFERGNELMDRKGGGPMAWDQFYGKTASAFFYHPTDANTRYLFGNDNPRGLAPVPAPQRPPQLDYFYRANDQRATRARAEAAALSGRVDALVQRRRQLEAQQALLWTKVAAAMVAQRQVPDLPLYVRRLKSDPAAGGAAVMAIGRFLLAADQSMAQLADLPSADGLTGDYRWLRDVLGQARKELQDGVTAATADDAEAAATVRPLVAAARRLSVIGESVADAAQAAADADAAGDDAQRRSARGLLQAGLLELAEAVAALDEDAEALAARWRVEPTAEPRLDRPSLPPLPVAPPAAPAPPAVGTASHVPAALPAGPVADPAPPAATSDVAVANPVSAGAAPADAQADFVSLFDGRSLGGWRGVDRDAVPAGWDVADGCLVRNPTGPGKGENLRTAAAFGDFELELEFRVEPKTNSGVIYLGGPEYQILDDDAYPQGRNPLTRCGSAFDLVPYAARDGVARPAGQWNRARLVVRGTRVEHWLNGTKVVDYELYTPDWQQRVARHPRFGKQIGFGRQRPAPIELQAHTGRVWFRDIRIRPLS